MKPMLKALWVASTVLSLAACTTARRSEPIVGYAAVKGAGFAEGRRAFMAHCHMCHPGGEAGLGPALNDKPLPGFLIKFQVRHGLGTMPAMGADRLDDAELDVLVNYVIALRRAGSGSAG